MSYRNRDCLPPPPSHPERQVQGRTPFDPSESVVFYDGFAAWGAIVFFVFCVAIIIYIAICLSGNANAEIAARDQQSRAEYSARRAWIESKHDEPSLVFSECIAVGDGQFNEIEEWINRRRQEGYVVRWQNVVQLSDRRWDCSQMTVYMELQQKHHNAENRR